MAVITAWQITVSCRPAGELAVVFTGKKRLGFQAVDQLAERADFALQVAVDVFAFFCQIEVGGNVVGAAGEAGTPGIHRTNCVPWPIARG